MQEYFPEHMLFHPTTITKHQYYAQCHAIAAHFGYQMWSKEFEPLLIDQHIRLLEEVGRIAWQKEKAYGLRSHVELCMLRYKKIGMVH